MLESAIRTMETNPAKLTRLYVEQFKLCAVKRGETVAIVSDLGTRREYIQSAFAAAEELGADIYELCVNAMPGWTRVGVPTIGQCKGTLEAVAAADIVVIFHVPLFSRWLKTVTDGGTRVLMIIDAPDALAQLMSPPGLKEACKHAESIYRKSRSVRVTSAAGTDLRWSCGEYPVMTQWGYADERGHFDHWGGGHIHTFPNEGSAEGTVIFSPGDIVILPYCRYVADPVKLTIREGHVVEIEGGLDAKLMRDWLEDGKSASTDRDPYASRIWAGASIRRRCGTALRSTVICRRRRVPLREPSPATFSFPRAPIPRGAASASRAGTTTSPCAIARSNSTAPPSSSVAASSIPRCRSHG